VHVLETIPAPTTVVVGEAGELAGGEAGALFAFTCTFLEVTFLEVTVLVPFCIFSFLTWMRGTSDTKVSLKLTAFAHVCARGHDKTHTAASSVAVGSRRALEGSAFKAVKSSC